MAADTNPEPLITVIVPVRNRAALVTRTLDSIAAQSLRPLRLIIVDNASSDGTTDIINTWATANRCPGTFDIDILSQPVPGAAATRNCGLAAVKTPYVAFFDSDDEMRPQHLATVTRELAARPDTDILYFDIAVISPEGWTAVKSFRHHDLAALHILHCILRTHGFVVRTHLLRKVGAWNESLPVWNDLELGTRLLLSPDVKVRKLYGDPQVWVHHHEQSLTGADFSSRGRHHLTALQAIEAAIQSSGRPSLSLILHARRLIAASIYRREGHPELADAVLAPVSHTTLPLATAMKMGLIYTVNRLFGRGGSTLALHWFAEKASRC